MMPLIVMHLKVVWFRLLIQKDDEQNINSLSEILAECWLHPQILILTAEPPPFIPNISLLIKFLLLCWREARKCQKTVCIESYRSKLDNCRHLQPWERRSDSMDTEVLMVLIKVGIIHYCYIALFGFLYKSSLYLPLHKLRNNRISI